MTDANAIEAAAMSMWWHDNQHNRHSAADFAHEQPANRRRYITLARIAFAAFNGGNPHNHTEVNKWHITEH